MPARPGELFWKAIQTGFCSNQRLCLPTATSAFLTGVRGPGASPPTSPPPANSAAHSPVGGSSGVLTCPWCNHIREQRFVTIRDHSPPTGKYQQLPVGSAAAEIKFKAAFQIRQNLTLSFSKTPGSGLFCCLCSDRVSR